MVKQELCEKVVEVRWISDTVMTFVIVFEENVLRLICGYVPQSGRRLEENQFFSDELNCDFDICIVQVSYLCA